MPIPLRTSAPWALIALLERAAPSQDTEYVRSLRRARDRMIRLPGASLVTGGLADGVEVSASEAHLPDGTVLPLRIYRPRGSLAPLPVVVNFHGGGWSTGSPRQSDWWCSSICARAGVAVVSVAYRLAPEHPFPTAPEDCYAATSWVSAHAAHLGVDATRLAVMGDSAGGNLAATVSVLARDRGGPSIALQVLIYPSVDLQGEFASEVENATAPVLTKRDIDRFSGVYIGDGDRCDPRASPLRAKHDGLAPALIQTAQHDPLRDQGQAYADALRAAGVPVRLTNYVDAVHGYISVPGLVPAARQAVAEAAAEIRAALS